MGIEFHFQSFSEIGKSVTFGSVSTWEFRYFRECRYFAEGRHFGSVKVQKVTFGVRFFQNSTVYAESLGPLH